MDARLRTLLILLALIHLLFSGCDRRAPAPPSASVAAGRAGSNEFQSPGEAFEEYRGAIEAGEWGKSFDAMSPAMQNRRILELCFASGMYESKLLYKYVDKGEIAAAIGTEPTEEQLSAVLLQMMKDKRAFFVEAATEMADDIRESVPRGPLRNVTIANHRARGIASNYLTVTELETGEQPQDRREEYPEEVFFLKSTDRWLIDVRPDSDAPVHSDDVTQPADSRRSDSKRER